MVRVMTRELQIQRLKELFKQFNLGVDVQEIDFEAHFDPELSLPGNIALMASYYPMYVWRKEELLEEMISPETQELRLATEQVKELTKKLSIARKSAHLSEVEKLKSELKQKERELRETESSVELKVQQRLKGIESEKLTADEREKEERKEVEKVLLFENAELLKFLDEAVSGTVSIRLGAINLLRGEIERRGGIFYDKTYLLPLRSYEGYNVPVDFYFFRHPDIGIFRCKPKEKCTPITLEYVIRALRSVYKAPPITPITKEMRPPEERRVLPGYAPPPIKEYIRCKSCRRMYLPLTQTQLKTLRRTMGEKGIITDYPHASQLCLDCLVSYYGYILD